MAGEIAGRFDMALHLRCTSWLARKPSVLLGLLAGRPIRAMS
jgi:hypothetical protein